MVIVATTLGVLAIALVAIGGDPRELMAATLRAAQRGSPTLLKFFRALDKFC